MGRYGISYVVGSLVGVAYDWADCRAPVVLVALVLVVGVVDGTFSGIDARSPAVGAAYVLAWLCYLPVFLWLVDDDTDRRDEPHRLG